MGVFDFVRNGVQEMMIARPDNLKQLIVYKHPDQNVPMYSQLTVDSDECAVFFKDGRVMGVLPPGRVTLQSQNIPFLNNLITSFTGGNVFITEIFFVKTAPVRSVPFGGPIGDMLDPLTGEQVQPRIFGEMSVVVVDPVKFVVGYAGQAATGDNNFVLDWIKGLFMNGVKTTLGELCDSEGKSLLQAVSLTSKTGQHFGTAAKIVVDLLSRYRRKPSGAWLLNVNVPDVPTADIKGVRVTRLGKRHKAESVVKTETPRGETCYWVGAAGAAADAGEGTDFHAVGLGYVSVTPLQMDLTNHAEMPRIAEWIDG